MFTLDFFSRKVRLYVSKSEYYETITTENSHLKSISDNLYKVNPADRKTNQKILFNNKVGLTCGYKEIVSVLGKPVHKSDKGLANQHTILFYKKKIGGYKLRLEIHLVHDTFLVGFITFNVTSKSKREELIQLIIDKYVNEEIASCIGDFKIYNDDNEFLKVIDSVDLTLVYGIDSKDNKEAINKIAEEKELRMLSKTQRENLLITKNI